ncbi:MAG: hypothetical protein HDT11_03250 [Helicobacter sp.]|nr:hypothetical protein [Helicobacter sp.]
MLKRISVATLCVAIGSSLAFATPQTPNVTGNERDLLTIASLSESTDDLLAIASNGALTSESAGVYQLNSTEMDEVHGGKFRLKIKNFCIGVFWFCK